MRDKRLGLGVYCLTFARRTERVSGDRQKLLNQLHRKNTKIICQKLEHMFAIMDFNSDNNCN